MLSRKPIDIYSFFHSLSHACTHTHAHAHARAHARTHKYTRAHTHTQIHLLTNTLAHKYTLNGCCHNHTVIPQEARQSHWEYFFLSNKAVRVKQLLGIRDNLV